MRWYFNELSIAGQFGTKEEFISALVGFAKIRRQNERFRNAAFCSRQILQRPVTKNSDVQTAINSATNDIRRLILQWISKQGPFLEDDRMSHDNDYFEFEDHDVTEQGLGEASRRKCVSEDAAVLSFLGGNIDFQRSPLTVQHGLREAPLNFFDIPNLWSFEQIEFSIEKSRGEPKSWEELIGICRERFDKLEIGDGVLERLGIETFYPAVARRVPALLEILNTVAHGIDSNGAMSSPTQALWAEHSTGDKAWFTDESDQNKRDFEREMTFIDSQGQKIFAPWHGKIKTPQFRIHFEWPIPKVKNKIEIFYIGPKITKK